MDTSLSVKQIQNSIVLYNGGCRANLCIPNVSWGFFDTHEADLVVISKSGYMTEYEIKRSYSDFVADFKKHTNHFENKVLRLFYVVPISIKDKCLEFLKNHEWSDPYKYSFGPGMNKVAPCGLMTYNEDGRMTVWLAAPPLCIYTKERMQNYKLFTEEQLKLATLGCMRFWDVKF